MGRPYPFDAYLHLLKASIEVSLTHWPTPDFSLPGPPTHSARRRKVDWQGVVHWFWPGKGLGSHNTLDARSSSQRWLRGYDCTFHSVLSICWSLNPYVS